MKAIAEYNKEEWSEVQPLGKLYFELGKTLYRLQDYEKATEALKQSLQTKDDSVEEWKIYNMLYDVCRQRGNAAEAHENLLKILATAPAEIAEEIIQLEGIESNIAVERDQIGKAKEEVLLLQGKAHLLMVDGKRREAIQLLEEALQKAKRGDSREMEKAVLLHMAEVWIEEGNGEKAARILEQTGAVEDQELKIRYHLLLGRTHLLLQNAEPAIANADNILAEHTNHMAAGILKVQALIVALRFKEALTLIHYLMANHTITEDLLFYKVEVLLEGNINIEEAGKLLVALKEKVGIDFIKNKLGETHIRFRPQHGNDNFFVAQVYKILSDDFSTDDALQQAEQALQEKVHFEGYEYPHGIIYELKAELLERQQNFSEGARFYYLSGKEYYWNGDYRKADAMFANSYRLEKEKGLEPPLIDNYWYYADSRVQLSYTGTDPYVDEEVVKKAANIWYEAYRKQKPSFNDAWAYLTATLIHEQLAKLPDKQKQKELFYCWFYAEHNLLIDNTNPKAWGFISRAFRGNGLDENAAVLAEKAYTLDKREVFFWEEKATTLLNIGKWQEAEEFLQKLIAQNPTEVFFKAYQGYALYHLAHFKKAQSLLNEVVATRGDWMWGRHLRLMINWMLQDEVEIKKDAEWIWEKRNNPEYINTTTHEFAYAAYFLGHEQQALTQFKIGRRDTYDERISSLFFYCIYYVLKKDEEQVRLYVDRYKKEARHVYNFTELKNAFISLSPERKDLMKEMDLGAALLMQKQRDLERELKQFGEGCSDCDKQGSIGWEAINLSFFRLAVEQGQWQKALDTCLQFQNTPNARVDHFHLWNRYYLALKNFFLENPKAFLSSAVRSAVQEYADASPYNNIESLADVYTILSITGKKEANSNLLKSKAVNIYAQTSGPDAPQKLGEWQHICAQLLPELELDTSETTAFETARQTECSYCGAEVVSRSQKFCFSCGARLA